MMPHDSSPGPGSPAIRQTTPGEAEGSLPCDAAAVEGVEAARDRSRSATHVDPAPEFLEVDHDRDTIRVGASTLVPGGFSR